MEAFLPVLLTLLETAILSAAGEVLKGPAPPTPNQHAALCVAQEVGEKRGEVPVPLAAFEPAAALAAAERKGGHAVFLTAFGPAGA